MVILDRCEAALLFELTDGLEPATVSACPDCGSRVIAAVALVDLLADGYAHARRAELVELAEDAPTLHLYVLADDLDCTHPRWLDPGSDEWLEAVEPLF